MFLVDNYLPATARGCCYLCGASKRSDDELLVDTNVTIDFEGRLAICGPCVRQMALLVGMIDAAALDEAVAERDAARRQVDDAMAARVTADQALDAVVAWRQQDHVAATGEQEGVEAAGTSGLAGSTPADVGVDGSNPSGPAVSTPKRSKAKAAT